MLCFSDFLPPVICVICEICGNFMNLADQFPLMFCLNLAKRQDRRGRCEQVFEDFGLRVFRFPAVNARYVKKARGFESAGRYAHAVSTRLILRRAMQLKAPAVFILKMTWCCTRPPSPVPGRCPTRCCR